MDAPESFEAALPPGLNFPPPAEAPGWERASWVEVDPEGRFEPPAPRSVRRPAPAVAFGLALVAWLAGTLLAIGTAAAAVWFVPGWAGPVLGVALATVVFAAAILTAASLVYGGRP